MEALSIRLKELLTEKGITAYKLSSLSGVSEATISDIKLIRNKSVGLDILQALAHGMGIGLDEFFNSPLFKYENIID
ncbi:MAG: helix-turn-helix transcriptional regulator [Clostridia bacterium]|nr:helix-turn-helix transcriptional regulator [Clostridia bacterium]